MAASNLRVALMLCLNLFSSLSIVFVNKVTYLFGEMPLRNVFLAATVLYFHFIDLVVILLFKISINNIDIDQFHWDINRSLSLPCCRIL